MAKNSKPASSGEGPGQIQELKQLVVGYAKQETLVPITQTGSRLKFGIVGAVLTALGGLFLLLATLRGLQQIPTFSNPNSLDGGAWSWVPYFITVLVGAIEIAILGKMIQGSTKKPPLATPTPTQQRANASHALPERNESLNGQHTPRPTAVTEPAAAGPRPVQTNPVHTATVQTAPVFEPPVRSEPVQTSFIDRPDAP